MTLTLLATVGAALAATPSQSVGQEIAGLSDAVAYYHEHATSDLKHIQEATKRFEALAIQYPVSDDAERGWLPAYWTSFAYTQLSLFVRDERARPYVDLAELYLDQAKAGKPEGDARIDADFHALEAMVLGFKRNAYPEQAEVFNAAADEAWEMARTTDPDNPMGVMNSGLTLIADEDTREEAYELLDRAIELYEPRMDSSLPNWGREFIDVWMGNYPRPESASGTRRDLLSMEHSDWTVRQDREGVGDRPRITREGGALKIVTGGSSILYPPASSVTGSYRVELDVALFDPDRRNEGFGLIFGGSGLSGPDLVYGYFLIRQDGMALVKRRAGSDTFVVRDWQAVPGLRRWSDREEGSDRVTNTLVLEVGVDGARFSVNGTEVHRVGSDRIATDGLVGLRVNHGVRIQVERFVLQHRGLGGPRGHGI